MSDFPENLQIKREPSPPSTPENKSPKSIKAKLNLHVKRRLQDLNQSCSENVAILSGGPQVAVPDIKQELQKNEAARQKRPYHKRTDKSKNSAKTLDSGALAISTEANATQRKYKHKIKQVVANENPDISTEDHTNALHQNTIAAGAISAGDDEDNGHDNDLKSGREKEKCPDVLGMVLSMKKRELMQDPQVQHFLKEIMEVIKN